MRFFFFCIAISQDTFHVHAASPKSSRPRRSQSRAPTQPPRPKGARESTNPTKERISIEKTHAPLSSLLHLWGVLCFLSLLFFFSPFPRHTRIGADCVSSWVGRINPSPLVKLWNAAWELFPGQCRRGRRKGRLRHVRLVASAAGQEAEKNSAHV